MPTNWGYLPFTNPTTISSFLFSNQWAGIPSIPGAKSQASCNWGSNLGRTKAIYFQSGFVRGLWFCIAPIPWTDRKLLALSKVSLLQSWHLLRSQVEILKADPCKTRPRVCHPRMPTCHGTREKLEPVREKSWKGLRKFGSSSHNGKNVGNEHFLLGCCLKVWMSATLRPSELTDDHRTRATLWRQNWRGQKKHMQR